MIFLGTTGKYTNGGTSWSDAKNNIQDAINDLRATGDGTGVVYLAAGTYYPTESTETNADGTLYTAIKIYEGISVYGGFDEDNPESKPEDRKIKTSSGEITISEYQKNSDYYPQRWQMANQTIISGDHSSQKISSYLVWNATKNNYTTQYPGNSYHVVWFATNGFDSNNRTKALTKEAIIDGFTITGGYASNRVVTTGVRNHTSYGGGVYMVDGCVMRNCRITENASMRRGGGVFMYQGGTINHLTIVRNKCNGAEVVNDGRRLGRTGGLYIDKAGNIYNTVAWGNEGLNDTGSSAVQYAAYTTSSSEMPKVYFSAFSQNEITDWSSSSRTSVYTLAHDDATASSSSLKAYFTKASGTSGITKLDDDVSWSPKANTDLRGKGIKLSGGIFNINRNNPHSFCRPIGQ